MEATHMRCYLKTVKQNPSLQSGISIFRRWQKDHADSDMYNCHIHMVDGKPCLSKQAEDILSGYVPELSLWWFFHCIMRRNEELLNTPSETDIVGNDMILESIVNDIFKNDIDDGEGGELAVDGEMK